MNDTGATGTKNNSERMRVMAVASFGGHWVQLLRITERMNDRCEFTYVATDERCRTMVGDAPFHTLRDFSRWDAWRAVPSLVSTMKLLRKVKPQAVVTTGAAPALLVFFAAKILGIKTVWVDSIANARQLSLCGRIASRFASATYTQWEHLKSERVKFAGSVLGTE